MMNTSILRKVMLIVVMLMGLAAISFGSFSKPAIAGNAALPCCSVCDQYEILPPFCRHGCSPSCKE
jgi:hypothetical protein